MSKMMLATRLRAAVLLAVLGFALLMVLLAQRASSSLMTVKMMTTIEQVKRAEKNSQWLS
ncbi:hypothetical protein [Roseateles albus]|uniref:Methyl-accepting chemotaxis protein n=1 Tax=Roseateles albus TaxID=2987525 RepID=A0ABT5KD82_9BURK|nr:hypothetical protein [Roseateles albus]MDC8771882.1 hypothetical protein [Roseateles albus]